VSSGGWVGYGANSCGSSSEWQVIDDGYDAGHEAREALRLLDEEQLTRLLVISDEEITVTGPDETGEWEATTPLGYGYYATDRERAVAAARVADPAYAVNGGEREERLRPAIKDAIMEADVDGLPDMEQAWLREAVLAAVAPRLWDSERRDLEAVLCGVDLPPASGPDDISVDGERWFASASYLAEVRRVVADEVDGPVGTVDWKGEMDGGAWWGRDHIGLWWADGGNGKRHGPFETEAEAWEAICDMAGDYTGSWWVFDGGWGRRGPYETGEEAREVLREAVEIAC